MSDADKKKKEEQKVSSKSVNKKDKKDAAYTAADHKKAAKEQASKKKKKTKDLTKPKKARSAYICFTTEQLPLMKKEEQYQGDGSKYGWKVTNGQELKHTDFMSFAGDRWSNMSVKDKVPYDKLAEKDKERHTE